MSIVEGSDTDCELTSRDYDRLQYVKQRALAKIARIKQRARMGIDDDSEFSDDSFSSPAAPPVRKFAKIARVRVQPKPKLHLSVRCRNLFEMDTLSTLQAVLGLFRLDTASGQFVLMQHAVAPRSELNPDFEQFAIDFPHGEKGQEYLLRLYDRPAGSRIVNEEDVLGSAHFVLDDLIRDVAVDEEAVFSISNPRHPVLQRHLEKAKATFFVKYSLGERKGPGRLVKVSCSNLPCETEKHSAPFAVLFKQDSNGFFQFVGRSESTTERVFPSFHTPLWVDDGLEKFKLSVYDSSSTIVTEQSRYGSCEFSNGDLKEEGELVKRLHNQNKRYEDITPLIHITVLGAHYDAHKRVDSAEVWISTKTVPREPPQVPNLAKKIMAIMSGGRGFLRHVIDPSRGPLCQRVMVALKPDNGGVLHFTPCDSISSPSLPTSSSPLLSAVCASSSVPFSAITALGEGGPGFVGRSSCFCFTVLAPPVCLHLEASHRNQRDAWLLGLRQLIPYLDPSCKRLDISSAETCAECPLCSVSGLPTPRMYRTLVVSPPSTSLPLRVPGSVDQKEILRQAQTGLEGAKQTLLTLRRQRTGLEEENKRVVNETKLQEAIHRMMFNGQDFLVVIGDEPPVKRFVQLQQNPSALVWLKTPSLTMHQILLATVVDLQLRPTTPNLQNLAKTFGAECCLSFKLINNSTVGLVALDRMKRDAWGLSLRLLLRIEEPTPTYAHK